MECPTSFEYYQKIFQDYAARYDQNDRRVVLKIIHTEAVVSIMEQLCTLRKLPEHTRFLALLCAQFHDIGRFEQLRRFDTFLDHKSVDHAALSCEVLKENQILSGLSAADQAMVLTAIENHNKYEIEPGILEAAQEQLELCKLIRDADKCDIFRVFATDDMVDVVGVPDAQVAKETISPEVLAVIREHRCVDKRIRKTYLDFWISFLGFFFDLNYPETAAIAKKQGYYRVPFDRTKFQNPTANMQVQEVLSMVEDYLADFEVRGAEANDSSAVPASLETFFSEHPKVALAFSGGVDSAYLLYAAKACGAEVRAYYAATVFQPEFEREDAKRLAKELGAEVRFLPFDVLSIETVRKNPADRCYYCKTGIFHEILKAAEADGFSIVIDGTNASDDTGDRPGMRALRELKVLSPLRLCGITKAEIREYSKKAGLFTWNKPAYACLATRIPTGMEIEPQTLEDVEWAESLLFSMGFSDFRVRILPMAAGPGGAHSPATPVSTDPTVPAPIDLTPPTSAAPAPTARIQLPEAQLPLFLAHRKEIVKQFKTRFQGVLLDMETRE